MAKQSKGYNGNLSLKRQRTPINWTKALIDEYKKCAADPIYFAQNYIKIVSLNDGLITIDLYDYQLEIIDKFNKNRNTIVLTGRQQGKALSLDTPILTPNGFVNLGDISVGDAIYGRDGKETKVTFITETMNDRLCYKVNFGHGETIIADAEHLWALSASDEPESVMTTAAAIEFVNKKHKGKLAVYTDITKPIEFAQQDHIIPPYILGLWLGDGSANCGGISCHKDDYSFYKKIIESSGYKVSDFKIDRRTGNCGVFNIYGLMPQLRKLGVLNNKHIPESYIFTDVESRLELFRGLMDTDGFVNIDGNMNFYQSNEKFIHDARLILSTLGVKSSHRIKKTTHKDCHVLTFTSSKFKLVKIPRKLDRISTEFHQKNDRLYIKSIEPIDSVPVRCLQVDNDDHMFLCGNTLIPTHNTTTAVCLILHYVLFNEHKLIALLAQKSDAAREILSRIQLAYENLPDWLQQGVVEWNKGSIELENGCKIIASATTGSAIRGKSCVGGNTKIKVRNKNTGVIEELNMDELAYILNTQKESNNVLHGLSNNEQN